MAASLSFLIAETTKLIASMRKPRVVSERSTAFGTNDIGADEPFDRGAMTISCTDGAFVTIKIGANDGPLSSRKASEAAPIPLPVFPPRLQADRNGPAPGSKLSPSPSISASGPNIVGQLYSCLRGRFGNRVYIGVMESPVTAALGALR